MNNKIKHVKHALAVAVGLLSFSASATNILTAEEVATIQQVSSAQVSPDGESVAFVRSVPRKLYLDKDGLNWGELHLVDDKGVERPYITGEVNVRKVQWSADSSLIYFLAKMKGDKFTSLYQIPFNGGQASKVISLKGTSISSYALSEDNKKIAILAKPAKDKSIKELKKLGFKAEVYEEDLTNQQLYVVDLKAADKPLTPEAWNIDTYVSDVQWSPKGNSLLVKTQPTALIDDKYMKSQWHIVDASSQEKLTSFVTEGKLGAAEFSHDGRYVAIHGAEDKHDPATGRLFLGDTKTGEVTDWLPNHLGHVADFEWANDENKLYLVTNVNAQSIVATIKPGKKKFKEVVRAGKFIASNLSISDSDKTIAIKAHTSQHPTEVYMLRGRSHKQTRLTDSNEWLNDEVLAKQEEITLKARDGVEIGGVLVYPIDYKKGQRYPLIMSVHGGPESHDKDGWVTNYSRPGQMAATQGYAVFYPNYRGSTGKGVDYSKLGQNDYAGKEFDDLVDFKEHLVDMGLVDTKRVGITGGSYGGYASAWAATKLTKHFATSVMFVGVTNQLSKFGTTDISNEMHLVHARSYPWDKWQWYLERSPIYWAGQSETPLLIMHGKDDPRVHPAQSMELYRYMKVQGKDVRLVYYPGEGHGNKRVAAKYDYTIRMMRWMDHYLKNGGKEMPTFEIDHKGNLEAAKKDK
ncbi:S9 family peptidase [Psychrobium sp. 1_MG-2023]|uniref:alpha/beta hydrolase family protein n=1 Tax=Psychrobium sp. 1_MG-2023 TaxID=3062624 RepID=UPI000C34AE87|nr:S9 family peptidase [Psychrobium sp. 1_MG-2023]MDP2561900.1 S9 family peptidase [Psychrobium sp. 1_MG-2023]PKF59684.1 S9 family peptidase [Alteromonadales bacterium alter-6D02]